MATEKHANSPTPSTPSTAWATITAGINASETVLALSTLSPFPASVQFRILIDNELMLVTALPGGLAATVTRGVEGTTAAAHSSGASVYHVLSAAALARSPRSMTTLGDIEYLDANGAPARLGVGSVGQVLTVAGGLPSWASPVSGSTTQVLFNDAGAITGNAAFLFNKTTGHAALGAGASIDGGQDYFGPVNAFSVGLTMRHVFAGTDAGQYVEGLQSVLVMSPSGNLTGATSAFAIDAVMLIPSGETNNLTGFNYSAVQGYASHEGSGTVGEINGFYATALVNGPGTLQYGIGLMTSVSAATGGTMQVGAGVWILAPSIASGGSIATYYGIWIDDQSSSLVTTNYAINYADKFMIDKDGKVDAPAYKVGGVAGVSFGPAAVASITVVNGIVTAIS